MKSRIAVQASAFSMAFLLVTLVNFYTFDRLTGLLELGNGWLSLTYAFGLSSMLLAGFFVRTASGRGSKLLFVSVTTVYGLEFIALSALIPFEMINLILRLPGLLSGLAIILFVSIIAIISAVNARTFRVRTVRLPFPQKVKAALITDIHIGAVHGEKYLASVVEAINKVAPDIVLISGDIVSGATVPGSHQFKPFSALRARVFLAPGNHEYYEGIDSIRAALPPNVQILMDEEVRMEGCSVFGLDYTGEQGISGQRKIERNFDRPVIAIAHVPQFLPLPPGSVIVSGHYHAGQIFPVNIIGRFFVKYFKGVYSENNITLYVSPGTATWGPPMRFGSRNEITLLELGPL